MLCEKTRELTTGLPRKSTTGYNMAMTRKGKAGYKQPPSAPSLIWQSLCLWRRHWRLLGGIYIVYAALNWLLASGYSSLAHSFDGFKNSLDQLSDSRQFSHALDGFGSLFNSFGAKSDANLMLQVLLMLLFSLAIIWSLRQLLARKPAGLKQAFYRSMSPLVPFVLVFGLILLELLPMAISVAIFDAILASGAGSLAAIVTGAAMAGLSLLSLYWLTASIFALYIVSLPDMQPVAALRSAANLVRGRRLKIFSRLVSLFLLAILVMAVTVVPLIIWADIFVVPVYFGLSLLAVLFVHTYLYNFYRKLL